jgi:hypothetical protein
MHEVLINTEGEFSPEWIEGHDYRVPSVLWEHGEYQLYGLHLPYDWDTKIKRLEKNDFGILASLHFGKLQNWQITIDEETGLLTEIKLDKDRKDKVYLNNMSSRSGIYLGEEIVDLSDAIMYQRYLANYLNRASDYQISYAYINDAGRDHSGSIDLKIPESVDLDKSTVFNPSRMFENKAHRITGMFGTHLHDLHFDERGILHEIRIDQDACAYDLDEHSRTYFPHNVDHIFAAATLHGIAAEYINELLREGSPESWR